MADAEEAEEVEEEEAEQEGRQAGLIQVITLIQSTSNMWSTYHYYLCVKLYCTFD